MSLVRTCVRLRRSFSWIDLLVLGGVAVLLYGLVLVGQKWEGTLRPTVEIDLSPIALPWYTFFSVVRGFAAYGLSLVFTIAFGYIAASNPRAEKIMLPVLDILQSIPVLGFLPGLVLALVAVLPHSNTGLELAAVLMIFTGQVWNMTFSFTTRCAASFPAPMLFPLVILDQLAILLPNDDPKRLFSTLVRWGRYGGLLGHSAKDDILFLLEERPARGV